MASLATNERTGIAKFDRYVEDGLSGRRPLSSSMMHILQRHVNDMRRDDVYFDTALAKRVLKAIKDNLRFSNGKTVELYGFQLFILLSVYCWMKKDGSRRFRELLVMMPRGSGKSFIVALLAWIELLFPDKKDTSPPNVVIGANTHLQAGEVFTQLKTLCDESASQCRNAFKIPRTAYKHQGVLEFMPTRGKCYTVSSDGGTKDGDNISLAIVDEVGRFDDVQAQLITALEYSMGKRENPIIAYISTAYDVLDGIFKNKVDQFKIDLKSNSVEDSKFCVLFDLDKEDQENWERCLDGEKPFVMKVQPMYGLEGQNKMKDQYSATLSDAIKLDQKRQEFKIKMLNIFVQNLQTWIDDNEIVATTREIEWEEFRDKQVWIGFDGSQTTDLTSVAFLANRVNEDGKSIQFAKQLSYLPTESLEKGKMKNYKVFKKLAQSGEIKVTVGAVIDYTKISMDIERLRRDYNMEIMGIYYDRYNAIEWANQMTLKGYHCVPVNQSIGTFTAPTTNLEKCILDRSIELDKDKIIRYCFANVVMKYDHNQNCKPDKSDKNKKIDVVIALIQAKYGFDSDFADGVVDEGVYSDDNRDTGGVYEIFY